MGGHKDEVPPACYWLVPLSHAALGSHDPRCCWFWGHDENWRGQSRQPEPGDGIALHMLSLGILTHPSSGVSLLTDTVGTWCGWASPASTNAPLSQFGFTRSWWGEGVGGVGCVSTCLPLGIIHLHPLIPPCTLLPSPATPLAPCYPPYSAQSSTGWGCSMAFPGPPKSCCEPADPGTAQPCWVWEGGGSRWSVEGCTGAGSRQFGRAPTLMQAWP